MTLVLLFTILLELIGLPGVLAWDPTGTLTLLVTFHRSFNKSVGGLWVVSPHTKSV